MLFLIEYIPREGRRVRYETFDDAERSKVDDLRFEIELDLNRRGIAHEVVILQAPSEEALRKTHQRYFETLSDIKKSLSNIGN